VAVVEAVKAETCFTNHEVTRLAAADG
jgi:hypothetical protein